MAKTKNGKMKTDDQALDDGAGGLDDSTPPDAASKIKSAKAKAMDDYMSLKAKADAAKAVCDALDDLDDTGLDDGAGGLDDADPAAMDDGAGGLDDTAADDTAADDTSSGNPVDPGAGDADVVDDKPAKPAPAPGRIPPRAKNVQSARIIAIAREITGKQDESEVVGALQALAAGRSESQGLKGRVHALETALRKAQVTEMVRKAMREGKLTPKQQTFALSMGMRDPKELQSFIETLTPVVKTPTTRNTPDPTRAGVTAEPGAVKLSKEELEIAERMGLNPDDVLKQKVDNVKRFNAQRAAGRSEQDDAAE